MNIYGLYNMNQFQMWTVALHAMFWMICGVFNVFIISMDILNVFLD